MGGVAARLAGYKRHILRSALSDLLGAEVSSAAVGELEAGLRARGLRLTMIGGDMVWYAEEEPPTAEEILRRPVCPRCDGPVITEQVTIPDWVDEDTYIPGASRCALGAECPGIVMGSDEILTRGK